jgi:hypothetical protein
MNAYPIDCPKCKVPLLYQVYNTFDLTNCPSCDIPIRADVFPILFKEHETGRLGENILLENESSCFFHPQKRAVVPCAMCGRFLCALCDIEFNGQHVCPVCLETGKKKRKIKNLETHRVLYDDIALALAIIPLILFWITVITAPMSLYIAIRHWKSPSSIIPRTKVRSIVAIFFSSLQIVGWSFLFIKLLNKIL